MLCNWFKVDAISPVPLKGGLKKIPSVGRQREGGEREEKRRQEGGVGVGGVWWKTFYLAPSRGACGVS